MPLRNYNKGLNISVKWMRQVLYGIILCGGVRRARVRIINKTWKMQK